MACGTLDTCHCECLHEYSFLSLYLIYETYLGLFYFIFLTSNLLRLNLSARGLRFGTKDEEDSLED